MKKKPLVSAPEKSANDWLAEIMAASGPSGRVDQPPEGWMTIKEMCAIAETPETTMKSRIAKLVRQGKLQGKKYRTHCGRHIAEVWHYYKS
jgi:hypothetical protein